jgi:2-keto-4-pentenoate hydratase/2-oxohepta-3-ene-1,7-dioic acid hydratase in catechol pathway
MRFFSYQSAKGPAIAVDHGGLTIALSSLDASFPSNLIDLIQGGSEILELIATALRQKQGQLVERSSARFLPLISNPGKIICIGLNYQDHATETNLPVGAYPVVFPRYTSTLTGHQQPLLRPRVSTQFDYESELVAVIGRRAHYVAKDDALKYVAGYTVANDASLRDYQFRTSQFTVGKNFDATCALGPDFVTADELPAGGAGLKITTRLNGQTVQSGSTSDMIFNVATLVHLLSETMSLEPGDVILTGTPAGIGMSRKPPLYMKAGDVCECEVERVGLLVNTVRDDS